MILNLDRQGKIDTCSLLVGLKLASVSYCCLSDSSLDTEPIVGNECMDEDDASIIYPEDGTVKSENMIP